MLQAFFIKCSNKNQNNMYSLIQNPIRNNNNRQFTNRMYSAKVIDKDASKLPQEAIRKLVGTEVVDLSSSSYVSNSNNKSIAPTYVFQGYTSSGEFKINDNVISGPIIITKKMLLQWKVKKKRSYI